MAIYQWNKYNTVKTSGYVETVSSTLTTIQAFGNLTVAASYIFNPQNGTFSLENQQTVTFSAYDKTKYPYFAYESKIYLVESFVATMRWTMNGYELISTLSDGYSKGDLIGIVKSGSATDYPTNGLHSDGYWYEYIGEIRTIGNLKINGTLYDLTGEGYVKINGVMCPITSSLVKHGGTLSDMFIGG